jgi:hypothetical protein
MAASVSIGCRNVPVANLTRLVEARRLAADALVQFTKSADAGNRAVMADTDEASVAFAREADEATIAVSRDADALRQMLRDLGYSTKSRCSEASTGDWRVSRDDKGILELAVENTISGAAAVLRSVQEAADVRNSLEARADRSAWHVQALVATAVAAVREIQESRHRTSPNPMRPP